MVNLKHSSCAFLPYRGRSVIVKTEATHSDESESAMQPKSKHRLVTSKVAIAEVPMNRNLRCSRGHSSRVLIAHGEGLNLTLLEIG
ncbi:MAG: hypothetical protein R3E32_23040 [Chitinophagales bacterium]